jgi:hypothetical protein
MAIGNAIAIPFTRRNNLQEMRYPVQTINLVAGVDYTLTTTITTKPYSVEIYDSSGDIISSGITVNASLVGGVCVVTINSSESLNGIEVNILY